MPPTPPVSLLHHFADLSDPRTDRCRRHELLDIIGIALCAVIAGADPWIAVEAYGHAKKEWLAQYFRLPNGIPSHDTFGRVFARLHPQRFREGFLSWTRAVAQLTQGTLISLDGKTVKASFDRATASAP